MAELKHLSDPLTQKYAMCERTNGTLVHDMKEFNCLGCRKVYDEAAQSWRIHINWDRPRDWQDPDGMVPDVP